MDGDGAGLFWTLAVVGGPILLGAALLYGFFQWRSRSRAIEPVRDEATERNYRAEDRRIRSEESRRENAG